MVENDNTIVSGASYFHLRMSKRISSHSTIENVTGSLARCCCLRGALPQSEVALFFFVPIDI